jgi:hypothetical protein
MEFLKFNQGGQWELVEKAKPMTAEEMAAFKAKRDAYLREKHGMPSKEEHEKQLEAQRGRDIPKTVKPDLSHRADVKYKESYHSATREVAPGKHVYQGMPKQTSKDVSLPISKRPEFKGGGFERSPIRMSPAVRKK